MSTRRIRGNDVHLFGMDAAHRDERTVGAFGEEWEKLGAPLEQRFTKAEIQRMMQEAGLGDIVFSPSAPFWHALGRRG